MRYRIMQVHTLTGDCADWGIEDERTVAEQVALDLCDPGRHLMGKVEPMDEREALALRWARGAA